MQARQSGRLDLEFHRKQAKALARTFRAGDPEALARAEGVLGARVDRRFLLGDAQHVVAVEAGFRTWQELRRACGVPGDEPGERGEAVVSPGPRYTADQPVRVLIRHRGRRYDISDLGAAVELAGRPAGWLETARAVVDEWWLNVNRRGVVFVPSVEGRDHAWLASRVAGASLALYEALLELDA